jgi:hypothetical protein
MTIINNNKNIINYIIKNEKELYIYIYEIKK